MLFGEPGLWIIRKIRGGKPCLLRGVFSARKFEKEGFGKCEVYGDPALLLPLVYTPQVKEKFKYGIIPHMRDYAKIIKEYPKDKIINLNDRIENVIDNINSCEYIISTSLHGVIVAHAYGVPAIWVKEGYIYTDGIKFQDYFSSVGIPQYDGSDFSLSDFVGKSYTNLSENVKGYMLPYRNLAEVQRGILYAAPF